MGRYFACALAALGLLCAGAPGAARAQDGYPGKPTRLVVPYPPGGPTDIVARIVAEKMQGLTGQVMIVDNRPGAGTNIGTEAVVRAAPDGYTILMASFANALNKALFPAISWDPVGQLTGVAQISTAPIAMVVPASLPVNSLEEFLALLRQHPGKYNYGVGGAGSTSHLAVEMLKMMTGVQIEPIFYKGGGPAMQGLMQGDVHMMFDNLQTLTALLKGNKVKVLATTGKERSPVLPQLPTVHSILPGYEIYSWYGWLVPAKTPPELIAVLERAVARAVQMPDVRERFATLGITPVGGSAAQFTAFYRAETEKWSQVVRAAKIKVD